MVTAVKKKLRSNNDRELALITARSRNGCIGKNGRIPWDIPGEMSQFKELTMGNVVVMGRSTFEEIGRPLPGRKTIVVSGSKCYEGENVSTVRTLKEALKLAEGENIYIAGGYGLYKEALPLVDVMYITEVDTVIEDGDTFFPEFDAGDFDVTVGETAGDDIKYTRTVYRRRT